MSREKTIIAFSTEQTLTDKQRAGLQEAFSKMAERESLLPVFAESGMKVEVHRDQAPALEAILAAQQRTNDLLASIAEHLYQRK